MSNSNHSDELKHDCLRGDFMSVHIFVLNGKNFDVCIRRGIAGIPNHEKDQYNDALISRMAPIRKGDYILFYIMDVKELRGIYRVLDKPFFDTAPVWESQDPNRVYPFRVRIENSDYVFENPIKLNDVYDLKDNGLMWTFSLQRPGGASNTLFSITNDEFQHLFRLFLKLNPVLRQPNPIREPYPYHEPNLLSQLHLNSNRNPKYEYSVMALLLNEFAEGSFKDIFGEYDDFLGYIPTSFGREMDALLITHNPLTKDEVIAYNIVEVKRDRFDEDGLIQLLQYEDWFLRKKVNGDFNMLRTTAIAQTFTDKVVDYVEKRKRYEGKGINLLIFSNNEHGFDLKPLA